MELPKIEIKSRGRVDGGVWINGQQIGGVTRVALAWEAGDQPVVELEMHAGDLTVDAEVLVELVAGLHTLTPDKRRAALAQLHQALSLLAEGDD